MSTETPKMDEWLSLSCPRCKAKLRIKSAYGHMRGHCPNCGKAIDPVLPTPLPLAGSLDADESSGLVPIEEEWPEPAQLEGVDDRPLYEFGSLPSQWPEPKRAKPPELEGYGLEGGPLRPPPAPSAPEPLPDAYSVSPLKASSESSPASAETLPEAYPVDLPHAGPPVARSRREIPRDALQATPPEVAPPPPFPVATRVSEDKKEPEKIPPPPPLPPSRPLWEGVYTFPWHVGSLKVWLLFGLGMAIFGFLAAIFYQMVFVAQVLETGNPLAAVIVVIIPPLGLTGLFAGAYGAANFMSALEETAAGNDTFQGPDFIAEWFGHLLHLLWVVFCSVIPSILIGSLVAGVSQSNWGWLVGMLPALLLFPIFLLSSLAGSSRLAVLDGRVIVAFLKNPWSVFVLLVVSTLLAAICLGLAYLTLNRFPVLGALPMGLGWSTCLLIYARLLGRVAWVISQGGVQVRKRKRRRKKPAPLPDDRGSGTESMEVPKPASL